MCIVYSTVLYILHSAILARCLFTQSMEVVCSKKQNAAELTLKARTYPWVNLGAHVFVIVYASSHACGILQQCFIHCISRRVSHASLMTCMYRIHQYMFNCA